MSLKKALEFITIAGMVPVGTISSRVAAAETSATQTKFRRTRMSTDWEAYEKMASDSTMADARAGRDVNATVSFECECECGFECECEL